MKHLWDMSPREALSPVELPKSKSFRQRMTLTSANHPVLMRFLVDVDSANVGDVLAALAEEAVRARLAYPVGMAGTQTHVTPEVSTRLAPNKLAPKLTQQDAHANTTESTWIFPW